MVPSTDQDRVTVCPSSAALSACSICWVTMTTCSPLPPKAMRIPFCALDTESPAAPLTFTTDHMVAVYWPCAGISENESPSSQTLKWLSSSKFGLLYPAFWDSQSKVSSICLR